MAIAKYKIIAFIPELYWATQVIIALNKITLTPLIPVPTLNLDKV